MITKVGEHKVQCSDIMNGIDNLMNNDMADFVYSDPPWGLGNLKYWQTINKRHTGRTQNEMDYNLFLHQFFGILKKYLKDVAVIEYGQKWRDDIRFFVNEYGFVHHGCCTSLYSAGSKLLPVDIHLISRNNSVSLTNNFKKGCYELRGQKLVNFIFNEICPKNAKMILDPMCGMGYTAQATINNGMIFRGNELNEKRLGKTISRLKKSL
ncbi:MAG TPA: hypothetical protein DEG69_02420 [Flavobacteriaceae bacterium]|nr:hypothetical protein [Flavobacteriaceae bacterium]